MYSVTIVVLSLPSVKCVQRERIKCKEITSVVEEVSFNYIREYVYI